LGKVTAQCLMVCFRNLPAHNITIGAIHTNYAAHKKVVVWNLGRNLYDNNLRYVIRP